MGVGAIISYGPLHHGSQVVDFHARLQGVLDPCGLVIVQIGSKALIQAQGLLCINLGWGSNSYMGFPDTIIVVP